MRTAERAGITPDTVTVVSLFSAFAATVLLYVATPEAYVAAAVLIAVNGVLDIVDGELARRTHTASARGDLLDHTADRYADVAVVLGVTAGTGEWFLGTVAVSGVVFVAHAGTAAQEAGVGRLYGGLLTRADISVLVTVGALLTATGFDTGIPPFVAVLVALGIGGHVTAIQRTLTALRINNS